MTAATLTVCDECEHPRAGRHKIRCRTHIRELMATIYERWPLLDVTPEKRAPGEGRAPGFASTPPINLHVRAMEDPASLPWPVGPDDDDRPPLSVSGTLDYWRRTASRARGDLDDLEWLVHQPWAPDAVADLRTLAAQLLAATGDPAARPVGHCRAVIGLDERELLYCGEPLYLPTDPNNPRGDDEPIRDLPEIQCPECNRTYTGVELIRIKLIEDATRKRISELRSAREGVCAHVGGVVRHSVLVTLRVVA